MAEHLEELMHTVMQPINLVATQIFLRVPDQTSSCKSCSCSLLVDAAVTDSVLRIKPKLSQSLLILHMNDGTQAMQSMYPTT